MTKATAILGEKMRISSSVQGYSHGYVIDSAKVIGGLEEYPSPLGMLCSSLAGCMLILAGMAANKKKIDIVGMEIDVSLEMNPQHQIQKFVITVRCPKPLSEGQAKILKEAMFSCPVHRGLDPDIEKEHHFQWQITEE